MMIYLLRKYSALQQKYTHALYCFTFLPLTERRGFAVGDGGTGGKGEHIVRGLRLPSVSERRCHAEVS